MSKKKKRYAARAPRTVIGGIRAQIAQGSSTRVWWGRRWTEKMEEFRIGARMGRGRNYAISGQVSDLAIQKGQVEAEVQGASKDPYHCVIKFKQVEVDAVQRIWAYLQTHPILLAQLMANEMPYEMEEIFKKEHVPFFPQKKEDIWSHCSCPDYANPCKHLAAVYFLLGEALIRDPGILLLLRGLSLPKRKATDPISLPENQTSIAKSKEKSELSAADFYGVSGNALPPPVTDASNGADASLLARLGPLPFWRGQERFVDTLSHLYSRAATRSRIAWSGDFLDLRREDEKIIIHGANLQMKNKRLRIESP